MGREQEERERREREREERQKERQREKKKEKEKEEEEGGSESLAGLPVDLWRSVLQRLPMDGLARASCVCCSWRAIATDPRVLVATFARPWKISGVVGWPSSPSFWRHPNFALSHTLKRTDTVASLAVKYGVHVIDIKRLNNMISEHGIYSRERLLIPACQLLQHSQALEGKTCYIEMDAYARREVAVFYLDGERPASATTSLLLTRGAAHKEKYKREVIKSMKRCLKLGDDETAACYLLLAEGDLRAAYAQVQDDLKWEDSIGSR